MRQQKGGEKGVFLSHRAAWEAAKGAPFTLHLGRCQLKLQRQWFLMVSVCKRLIVLQDVSGFVYPFPTRHKPHSKCPRILEDDAVPMSFLPPHHGDSGGGDQEELLVSP